MKAEEFMYFIDQDEIKKIADSIGADIQIQYDDFAEMNYIRINIQFLGIHSHTGIFVNEYDYMHKDVAIDHIKRLIFSKLLDTFRDYLSSIFNFPE